jgi:uncharacterized membrane protein YfcA
LIPDPFYIVVVGLLVGGLVSLSGLGGAVVLLPLLILALGVSPIVAVGSGTLFSAITKIGAAGLHWHRGNVDLRLVAAMAVGSIPGALLGLRLLVVLRAQYGEEVNALLTRVIALLLIIIPLLMLVQGRVLKPRPGPLRDSVSHRLTRYYGGTLTGLVGGLLVGVTSVGSGSVIIMILLVILTGVAGLGHLGLGTVDLRLVAWLLVGSLPGAYLGFKLIKVVPAVWLRRALLALLVVTGIIML